MLRGGGEIVSTGSTYIQPDVEFVLGLHQTTLDLCWPEIAFHDQADPAKISEKIHLQQC